MRNAQQSPSLSWGGYPHAQRRDLAARPNSAGAAQGRAGQQPQEQGDERLRVVAQAARVEWRAGHRRVRSLRGEDDTATHYAAAPGGAAGALPGIAGTVRSRLMSKAEYMDTRNGTRYVSTILSTTSGVTWPLSTTSS